MSRRHLSLLLLLASAGFAGCTWDVTPKAVEEQEIVADETPEVPEEATADAAAPEAPETPDEPDTKEDCVNGTDDDGDGFADCVDWDCSALPECMPPAVVTEHCDDDADNDGDGAVDCKDSDCNENPTCLSQVVGPFHPPSVPPAKQAPMIDSQDL